MKAKKKNKIVFICTGNTCRSPMAAELFKREISALGLDMLTICSAGIQAQEKSEMNEKSKFVLMENGIDPTGFLSTQISEELVQESLAIVCMTEVHKEFMMDYRWNVLRALGAKRIDNNVYSFKEIVGYDVPDPYGQGLEKYRYVFQLLEVGMPAIKEKILTPKVLEKLKKKPKTAEKKPRKKSEKKSEKNSANA
jgi:protein-tyrosine-phosphatase